MAGGQVTYPGIIPQHVSPFFDWTYAQIGDVNRRGEGIRITSEGDPFKGSYRLLVFENDVLIGANCINSTTDAGKYKHAISRKLDLSVHSLDLGIAALFGRATNT